MLQLTARRVALGFLQVLVALTVIFFAVRAIPGDPAEVIAAGAGGTGESAKADPETVNRLRDSLGLTRPLAEQYIDYLRSFLTGDLGQSFSDSSSVLARIGQTLPNTVEIVIAGAVLGTLGGLLIGSWSATGGRAARTIGSTLTSLGISIPVYVLGSLVILLFALKLGWLPSGGFVHLSEDPRRHVELLLLPSVALSASFGAIVARTTASSVREVAQQDWVRTARAVGLSRLTVFRMDVLRNALTPVITVIGVEVGTLLGGTVLVERIFNWPGISSLLIDAIHQRDYPTVQGVVAVVSVLFIGINILVDVLNIASDPRIREGR